MIAGLLFFVGLVTILVTVVMVGYSAPALIQQFMTALDGGFDATFAALGFISRSLAWSATPLVVGLALLALARIIMLLAQISRSLRGN